MSLKERLTEFTVASTAPKAKLDVIKRAVSLLENGPLDSRSKTISSDWFGIINALLALGIAKRGSEPRMLELAADKGELRSAIADLEHLLSDNLILAEKIEPKPPYRQYGIRHREIVLLEAWYMRSERSMISLPNLSKSSIKTDFATYYIVPKSALADPLLHVYIWFLKGFGTEEDHTFLCLEWESLDGLYEKVMEGKVKRREAVTAIPEELSYYTFDRKIKLGRELLNKLDIHDIKKARQLRDILFELEEDKGEHSKIVGCLVSVGTSLGYRAEAEVDIGGNRIDSVWYKDGAPEHYFEVVLEGSLEEALFKLGRVSGKKFLVVRQSDRALIEARAAKLSFSGKVLEAEQVVAASQSLGLLNGVARELTNGSYVK